MGVIIEILGELLIEGVLYFPFYDKAPKWARVVIFVFNSMVLLSIGALIMKLLMDQPSSLLHVVSMILSGIVIYGFIVYIRTFLKSINYQIHKEEN